jgi:glutaredoxin
MLRNFILMFAFAATLTTADAQNALPQPAQPVVMYATSWCPYCAKAREYFARTGTAYTEYDIEKSADAHAEFKRLGGRGVPLILVGNQKMAGFNELAFESLLVRAERAR